MLLCVDIASQKTKLIGVKRDRKELNVAASLEFSASDLASTFGEYLRNTSADIDEIRVSGALEDTFHKAIIIPDVKGKMQKAALETEVMKTFGNDYQFKGQDLGEMPGPGNKVNRKMMTAGIKRSTVEELSQMFADSRIKPSIFTTYPVTVQALLEKLEILNQEPLGFVELDHPTSRMVIFKGKEIRVTRELPVGGQQKDPDHATLAKDIYRTLLFYTESFPNELVTKLVVAGALANSEIVENLKEKTGAKIVPFEPQKIFQGIEGMSGAHAGCLGLSLLDPGHFDFGFIPYSVQTKSKTRKSLVLCSSITVGIVLMLGLAVSRLSLNLKDLEAYHGGTRGEIKMKEDRLKELPLEFISHSIETSQPAWSEILLELAAAVPSGVALKTLTLKKIKNRWRGEVTGITDGSDEITSLLMVEEVQNNFMQSPLFKGVKLTEKELQGKQAAFKIIYQLNM
jgi:hypothetical protein